jgi:hypothetical protein
MQTTTLQSTIIESILRSAFSIYRYKASPLRPVGLATGVNPLRTNLEPEEGRKEGRKKA